MDINERLDKQAEAIRLLRKDRDTLIARIEALENGGRGPAATGFSIPPRCVQCDGTREPGRKALTCEHCSAVRNDIIKNGGDRSPLMRSTCVCCNRDFKRSMRYLCIDCSRDFKIWKAQ